jgi:hypothetical protein
MSKVEFDDLGNITGNRTDQVTPNIVQYCNKSLERTFY